MILMLILIFNSIINGTNGLLDDTGSGNAANPSTGNLLITGGSITINDGQSDILTISNSGNILTDKKIGTATDQEYIDFSTSNEVNVKVNNTERLSVLQVLQV